MKDKKINVLIHADGGGSMFIFRQSPGRLQEWGNVKFFLSPSDLDYFDWWVICHSASISKPLSAKVDPRHTVFISLEPPDWGRPEAFYNQFSHLVTCDKNSNHAQTTLKNGIIWWAGLKVKFNKGHQISNVFHHDYDSFRQMEIPKKKDRISIITSGNRSFPGHKKRLIFIEKLKRHPISKYIDFFGGYYNPIEDKLDGLWEYKYHIALENSAINDYWTEKFADPLLAYTVPIYYGCKNIDSYFPEGGYINIDIDNFNKSVSSIQNAIENNFYEKNLDALILARNKILNKYNILQLIADICTHHANDVEDVELQPLNYFVQPKKPFAVRVFRKLINSLKFRN
jgi:hypothetical protein